MASSSSSSPKPRHIFQTKVLKAPHEVDENAKAEEEKDLLELRLGRGGPLCSENLYLPSSSSGSSLSLHQPKQQNVGLGLGLGLDHSLPCTLPAVPSSVPFRVRRQPGLWFTLRSSPNRKREIWLPQIPKMYIRVKDDEKVTVLMVKTYLVTKLGLSNEAQIEILCRGQRLTTWQMLKHVRDTIWLPGLMESTVIKSGVNTPISIPNGAPGNHFVMCLEYERKY